MDGDLAKVTGASDVNSPDHVTTVPAWHHRSSAAIVSRA